MRQSGDGTKLLNMTTKEAFEKIYILRSRPILEAALKNRDFELLRDYGYKELTFDLARDKVSEFQNKIKEHGVKPFLIKAYTEEELEGMDMEKMFHDDAIAWGYLARIEYWKAVLNILEAGKIGGGTVADVEGPDLGVMIKFGIEKIKAYGEKVLEETKKMKRV